MNTYHKIQTVWLRDRCNKLRTLMEGQWAMPEFEYLSDSEWVFTEKVDGTNVRVIWDGWNKRLAFLGKSNKSKLPEPLLCRLEEIFNADALRGVFGNYEVYLYGEGFGGGIPPLGELYGEAPDFVLFDIQIGNFFLERDKVEELANALNVGVIPVVGHGSLHDAINLAKSGFSSSWGDFTAEGIVARPKVEMKNRLGDRVITKIKHKDFH